MQNGIHVNEVAKRMTILGHKPDEYPIVPNRQWVCLGPIDNEEEQITSLFCMPRPNLNFHNFRIGFAVMAESNSIFIVPIQH